MKFLMFHWLRSISPGNRRICKKEQQRTQAVDFIYLPRSYAPDSGKFPELIKQVVPVLPPAEAAAIYVKHEAAARKQLPKELIGVWFISPCPSKETNIRQSVDVHHTELTGSFSLSEIYGLLLKNLGGTHELNVRTGSSYGMSWGTYGGEIESAGITNGLAIHGIDNVYDLLEQVSMNKMPQLDYVECSACKGGCLGGFLQQKTSSWPNVICAGVSQACGNRSRRTGVRRWRARWCWRISLIRRLTARSWWRVR